MPTIITGIFVYGLIVVPQDQQSGFAGSVALAIVMLPIVARTAQEVLALVPATLKEAAHALGIARWRTTVRVTLPTAAGGLITGALLAVARVAGETAPLILLSSIFGQGVLDRPEPGAGLDPGLHLPARRSRPARGPHPGLGGGAGPDRLRPRPQHRRPRLLRPLPQAHGGMTPNAIRHPRSPTMDSRDSTESPAMTEPNPEPQASPRPARSPAPATPVAAAGVAPAPGAARRRHGRAEGLNAYYGSNHAVRGVDLDFDAGKVTAIIGPSGCGKSTMVRCINRMHEEIAGRARRGRGPARRRSTSTTRAIDVVAVRRAVGMVFQKPNPFPTMSIFDNVASGLRLTGASRGEIDDRGREALRRRPASGTRSRTGSRRPGVGLSGGQQQRLCIARALAVEPEVLLMDEPCSALDPVATLKIEELIGELKRAGDDRDRHPQHAAGGAGRRHDRLHARRRAGRGRRRPTSSSPTPTTTAPSST